MCEDVTTTLNGIMFSCGMPLWGIAPFDAMKGKLIRCGALNRLPVGARSVITAIFPYYSAHRQGEISRYAAALDYHIVVSERIKRASLILSDRFAGYNFEPFCDSSPIPEVTAARLAGLGVLGQNGLLITPLYGSFVFIGEIVTDLELPPCGNPGGGCASCGRCASLCPAGALTSQGVDRERCISRLTQKKGELTLAQRRLICKAGTIWGCDICQNVCPMNSDIEKTYIDEFKTDIICTIQSEDLDDENFENKYASRAFMWRGKEVLKRNIGILHGTPDNNINEENFKK